MALGTGRLIPAILGAIVLIAGVVPVAQALVVGVDPATIAAAIMNIATATLAFLVLRIGAKTWRYATTTVDYRPPEFGAAVQALEALAQGRLSAVGDSGASLP
ncbi:MAG: hypothetical protein HKL95_00595 [Phycisphaerae bacterium]|nr:hypothetical protein [Phycisphaerae bacterium]